MNMSISPNTVLALEPCNHWKNPELLNRTLGDSGKPLAEVLALDTITNWEKLWLALRPEILGPEKLERFATMLVGAPPFSDDGTDSLARRRTFTGAMAIVTTMIDKRVLALQVHPAQIPAVAERALHDMVEALVRFIEE